MRIIKILFILILLTGIIYYQLDRYLFYYGKSDLHNYNLLPFKIEPDYRAEFEGGFALRDENGFTIAAKGNTYPVNNKTILINKVIEYGFSKDYVVVTTTDSKHTKYYLKFNRVSKDSSVIATMVVANGHDELQLDKSINIYSSDDYINSLVLYRNYSMFIIAIFIVIFTYKTASYKKSNKRIQNKS